MIIHSKGDKNMYSVNSEMQNWKELLIGNNEIRKLAFDKLLADNQNIIGNAVYQMRNLIINEGGGQDVVAEQLENLYKYKMYSNLQERLQELFQEPIQCINTYMKCIEKNNWTWDRILEEHHKNSSKRLWRIISAKNKKLN